MGLVNGSVGVCSIHSVNSTPLRLHWCINEMPFPYHISNAIPIIYIKFHFHNHIVRHLRCIVSVWIQFACIQFGSGTYHFSQNGKPEGLGLITFADGTNGLPRNEGKFSEGKCQQRCKATDAVQQAQKDAAMARSISEQAGK